MNKQEFLKKLSKIEAISNGMSVYIDLNEMIKILKEFDVLNDQDEVYAVLQKSLDEKTNEALIHYSDIDNDNIQLVDSEYKNKAVILVNFDIQQNISVLNKSIQNRFVLLGGHIGASNLYCVAENLMKEKEKTILIVGSDYATTSNNNKLMEDILNEQKTLHIKNTIISKTEIHLIPKKKHKGHERPFKYHN